jgi:hypothetical protein
MALLTGDYTLWQVRLFQWLDRLSGVVKPYYVSTLMKECQHSGSTCGGSAMAPSYITSRTQPVDH